MTDETVDLENENTQEPELSEEEFMAEQAKKYEERIQELCGKYGWNRRKAKRALDAHSKKQMKKFNNMKRRNEPVQGEKPKVEFVLPAPPEGTPYGEIFREQETGELYKWTELGWVKHVVVE
jgi:hypothetical protein